MCVNNGLPDDGDAHFDRVLREKFTRCVKKVAPPMGIWKEILEKVERALETGEWPDDLDEKDLLDFVTIEELLKDTAAIWMRGNEGDR